MKMTKQEQIEEMTKIVDEMYNVYTTTADDIAEGIYNAGYRKIEVFEAENQRLLEVNRQLNADYNRSLERLKSDCRQIGELNAEVKELKAELNARLTCNFVKTAQKQAQIEVLNRLKSLSIYDDNYLDGYVFIDDIEKLLEELTK